ncbi:MAG TPA: 2-oxo-4-hydroxy-4-carboxy-5-ureidoimidazoline decarboxylase, partial [Verrucomicrobium sp.]|nr:2-oxo-4-hydroxy-4-carboxy-5-ureidoimidazoline decarboxylase [Verrucomicrobium sp.]
FRYRNDAYRSRYGFPFVVCARLNDKRSILASFGSRLTNDRETEIATALTEIEKIAKLRLVALIAED